MKNYRLKRLIIVEGLLLLGIIMLYLILHMRIISLNCYINDHFNILCPSCGGTRMMLYIFRCDFVKAFSFHPVFFTTIIYLFIVNLIFIINSFTKRRTCIWIYPRMSFLIIFVIVLLIFAIVRNMV